METYRTQILESSTAIASISLRAALEFLRATPAAVQVLQPDELKAWAEMGRRLAMSNFESAASFFAAGVEPLCDVPEELRPSIFALCARQIVLSTSVARETFQSLPAIVKEIGDVNTSRAILDIATEIARRSAKHSTEFINSSVNVSRGLREFKSAEVTEAALALAGAFAARAGGIAADAWLSLPAALNELPILDATRLLTRTSDFLERGGGAALQVLLSGGEILRRAPEIFDEWIDLLWVVAAHGNASLVAFVRSSPRFLRLLSESTTRTEAVNLSRRVLAFTKEIAAVKDKAELA